MCTLLFSFVSSGIVLTVMAIYGMVFTAIYGAVGAILFVLCITIDVQMLISGNRKIKLTTNDYFYTCFQLYLDLFYFLFFSCEKSEI